MFGCTKCGACCRKVNVAVSNADILVKIFGIDKERFDFPYKWDESGACEKLIGNECSIYEDRPLICNVEKLMEISGIEANKFYSITATACNELMRAEGIYDNYKIKTNFEQPN